MFVCYGAALQVSLQLRKKLRTWSPLQLCHGFTARNCCELLSEYVQVMALASTVMQCFIRIRMPVVNAVCRDLVHFNGRRCFVLV